MYKTGVVIGKFYPPHKGHKYLIDTASSQVKHLTVIICGKEKEEFISPKLRAKWIREIHPNVEVRLIDDIYDPDDSKVWARNTIRWLGYVPEAVFTSEDYGERYAHEMGSKHFFVDRFRKKYHISGTMIRQNPLKYLEFLEPPVRAYFVKRICVLGAESTGTTTLSKDLAKHFQTVWVPEYGREYWIKKMKSHDMEKWKTSEFVQIAKKQTEWIESAARKANRVLIADTDAFATCLWHERYMGKRSKKVERIGSKSHFDLYILTGDEIPFIQDGFRDGENIRHWMHKLFVRRLKETNRPFIIVKGSRRKRLKESIEAIEKLLV